MCCFSRPVQMVGKTRIFARLSGKGSQYLVYQMTYSASEPLAMILPLPVALPSRENAVTFLNVKDTSIFVELERAFVMPSRGGRSMVVPASAAPTTQLAVHEVGDYVASFVPTMQDFKRLDKRFVIPASTWNKIPAYKDYGFAVFQLKAKGNSQTTPHPMAFEFPTRMPDRLFFPTVHIHDGQVHSTEDFDHALYAQVAGGPAALNTIRVRMPWNKNIVTWSGEEWHISHTNLKPIAPDPKPEIAAITQTGAAVYRRILRGNLPNQDTIIRPS